MVMHYNWLSHHHNVVFRQGKYVGLVQIRLTGVSNIFKQIFFDELVLEPCA